MIQALANDCMESRGMDYESPAEIFADLCAKVEGLRGANRCAGCGKHPTFWPVGQSRCSRLLQRRMCRSRRMRRCAFPRDVPMCWGKSLP